MDTKKLKQWQADAVAWAEANCMVRHPDTGLGPLRLEAHQRHWLREATKLDRAGRFRYQTCVASWPRREGKTLCVALVLCWRLATRLGQRLLILANSEQQAKSNIFALCSEIMTQSPALADLVPAADAQDTRITVRALDNVLECLTNNWRTLQGRPRTDALAVDELHAAVNTRAWEFATQQTEARDSQILVSSQAGAPVDSNPMWAMFSAAQKGQAPHLWFDYAAEHRTRWGQALAERERSTLLPALWDYQHCNSWGQTGAIVVASADLAEAAMPWSEPATADEWQTYLGEWRLPTPIIGLGLDRAGVGRGGDRTVCATVARWDLPGGQVYALARCAVLPTGAESEVLEAVRRSEAIFGPPARKYFESYQCADLVGKVRGATLQHPTIQRQQDLFQPLFNALRDGRFLFPEGAGVDPVSSAPGLFKAELSAFEADVTGTLDTTRWGTQRGHDDTVYATAWALCAAREARSERQGVNLPYVPGLHREDPGAWREYEKRREAHKRAAAQFPGRLAELRARMRGEQAETLEVEPILVLTSQGAKTGLRRKKA